MRTLAELEQRRRFYERAEARVRAMGRADLVPAIQRNAAEVARAIARLNDRRIERDMREGTNGV